MNRSTVFAAVFGMLAGGVALAQPAPPATSAQAEASPIYGCSLMTPQERMDFRARMRSAKTAQEREAIRVEHHKQMQERAKQRGVTLPAMPAAGHCPGMTGPGAGKGMGPGMMGPGAGKGMGPGMMGPGAGKGMGPGMMGPGAGKGMGPGMMGPARGATAPTPPAAAGTSYPPTGG